MKKIKKIFDHIGKNMKKERQRKKEKERQRKKEEEGQRKKEEEGQKKEEKRQRKKEEKRQRKKELQKLREKINLQEIATVFGNIERPLLCSDEQTKMIQMIEEEMKTKANLPFDEAYSIFTLDYNTLVKQLLIKYGPVNADYMVFTENGNCYRNSKLNYPAAGLSIHHIDENKYANLSHPEIAILFGPNLQRSDRLVYANQLEHCALHYLISKEDIQHCCSLGAGGIIKYKLGSFDSNLYQTLICKIWYNRLLLHCNDWNLIRLYFHLTHPELVNNNTKFLSSTEKKTITIQNISDWLRTFTIGITPIELQTYINRFNIPYKILQKNYESLYVLHHPTGVVALVLKRTNNKLFLINGGQVSLLPFDTCQSFYNQLALYYSQITTAYEKITPMLETISSYFKINGGSGQIHGLHVDYDMYSHILIYPDYDHQTMKCLPYTSTFSQWSDRKTITIKTVDKIMIYSNIGSLDNSKNSLALPMSNLPVILQNSFTVPIQYLNSDHSVQLGEETDPFIKNIAKTKILSNEFIQLERMYKNKCILKLSEIFQFADINNFITDNNPSIK